MISQSLPDSALEILSEVGRRLDKDIYPRVLNDGIVMPSDTTVPLPSWAEKEHENEKGKRRSTTGPRTGATRWQGSPERGRASSPAAPVVCSDLKARFENELSKMLKAYPRTRVWHQSEGLWLLTESTLLPGFWKKAVFLTGIPFAPTRIVRAWGFWDGIPLAHPMWIGPRHTNGDGSVCAFEPDDGTWKHGDSIITLLDLYSTWAVRHLHLQVFGRWPGRQYARYPYERLLEQRIDELCGCGSEQLYSKCCQQADLSRINIADAPALARRLMERNPPDAIFDFVRSLREVPSINEHLPNRLM